MGGLWIQRRYRPGTAALSGGEHSCVTEGGGGSKSTVYYRDNLNYLLFRPRPQIQPIQPPTRRNTSIAESINRILLYRMRQLAMPSQTLTDSFNFDGLP